MEDHNRFEIPDFKIQFQYPGWWRNKIENDNTCLFWDEYTGSFRITPLKIEMQALTLQQFLDKKFIEYAHKNPVWKSYSNRSCIYYEEIINKNKGHSKVHSYILGHTDILFICSFASDPELLNDEYPADEIEAALEEVDNLLNSIAPV